MSAHETDDPVKSQLLQKTALHRRELEAEVKGLSEGTQQVITTSLVTGAVLVLAYLLYTEIAGTSSGHKKKKKNKGEGEADDVHSADKEGPGIFKRIGATLANQALLFLLDVAREKLAEYLEAQKKQNEGA